MAAKEFRVPEIPEVPWEVPKDPELQPHRRRFVRRIIRGSRKKL